MTDPNPRVGESRDLGRGKRGVDLLLGSVAIVPLVALAALDWLAPPASAAAAVRTLAVIWAGSLLTFYAGVRRGLTFSEVSGGRWSELATMLVFFFWGVAALVVADAWTAAAGLAAVGALDAWAGRRREAPPYFAALRPPQLGLGALAMVAVALRSA